MAFQQGLSGLNSSARALDVVSNNIANASTVGFKGAQAQFADVYAASLGVGGASNVGIGANAGVVQQRFSQGNVSSSNNPLDLAVNGNGFFRMQKDPTNQTITYTRNGQFHLDNLGYIVNAQNLNLTGYPIENSVVNRAQLVPVQLDTSGVQPRATGASSTNPGIETQINLDDRETRSLTSPSPDTLAPWSANTSMPPNNLNTFNYSTSVTVYDQKGNDHALSMYFTRLAPSDGAAPGKNLWEVHFVLDSTDITDAVNAGTSGQVAGVPTLQFNQRGGIVTSLFDDGGLVAGEANTLTGTATLTGTPDAGSLAVYDGTVSAANLLQEGVDYTLSGSTVTFLRAPSSASGFTANYTVSGVAQTDSSILPTNYQATLTGSATLANTPNASPALAIYDGSTQLRAGIDYQVTGANVSFFVVPSTSAGFTANYEYGAGPTVVTGETVAPSFTTTLDAPPVPSTLVVRDASTGATLAEGVDYSVDTTTGVVSFIGYPPSNTLTFSYQTYDENALTTANNAVDYLFNIDITDPIFTDSASPFLQLFANEIPINFDGSTLFGSGYDVNKLTQDGYPYGRLSGVSVSPDGVLRGNYSNGQTKDIAQLVLVDFIAPTGLMSLGNNQWGETAESGQPLIGDPGAGNRGLLQSAAVEESNVDLTQELVNLITFQRNYQANAQSIKTQDQVMQTLVNLR